MSGPEWFLDLQTACYLVRQAAYYNYPNHTDDFKLGAFKQIIKFGHLHASAMKGCYSHV